MALTLLGNHGPFANGSWLASQFPAGAWGRWRSDQVTGSSGSFALTDLTGQGRTLTQSAGTITQGTSSANGLPTLNGNSTSAMSSSATFAPWPCTMVVIGRRTSGVGASLFGRFGASGWQTFALSVEPTNNLTIRNNDTAHANADATGGSVTCWTGLIGSGFRASMINGTIQPTMTRHSLQTAVGNTPVTVALGSNLYGMNFEFQEAVLWPRVLTLTELDQVADYAASRYGLTMARFRNLTPVATVALHGQSNASGRGLRGTSDASVPVEYRGAQTNVNIWWGSPSDNIGTAYQTYNLTNNAHMLGDTVAATQFGMDTSLGKEYIDRLGGQVFINKYAIGGIGLRFVNSATGSFASGNRAWGQGTGSNHWSRIMTNWWQNLQVQQAAGRVPDLRGVVWWQGEQDATDATAAGEYQANLTQWISDYRHESGFPSARFVLCRIHTAIDGTAFPHKNTVRAAIDAIGTSVSGTQIFSVDSYTLRDTAHVNGDGQIAIGNEISLIL